MYFLEKLTINNVLFYLIIISLVFCDEQESKENNRTKRTIGLFLQSLASFLNVQDVENTTPITFTTSAPGYKRKSPPPKVQKWPPLDLEITPWVLQAVPPTVATPSPSSYPGTTQIYSTTEGPSVHAQIVIIPLSETENNLNFKNEIKNGQGAFLRPENMNPKPMKYIAQSNYQSALKNYHFVVPPNFQNLGDRTQTEVYYWQKLFPNQRLGKEINLHQASIQSQEENYQSNQPQQFSQPYHQSASLATKNSEQRNHTSTINHKPLKQINLPRKDAESLIRLGYLYGRTINDELSNLGGNDFDREKHKDEFRSFIDVEPKFRFIHNSTEKSNDLSQLYLIERSKRLKNVNNKIKFRTNKNKNQLIDSDNDNFDKTNVEIVKSVEPMSYNIDSIGQSNYEDEKESKIDYTDIEENSSYNGPTFEMVKSFELPNSESQSGNTNFEFHGDTYENLDQGEVKSEDSNYSEISRKNNLPLKNKKITFIPPSERDRYELRKNIKSDRRLNKYSAPEKMYNVNKEIDQYNENEQYTDTLVQSPKFDTSTHNINYNNYNHVKISTPETYQKLIFDNVRQNPVRNKSYQNSNRLLKNDNNFYFSENIPVENPDVTTQKDSFNFESPAYSSSLPKQFSRYPTSRGRVKYHQFIDKFSKNQEFGDDFISKDESLKLSELPEYSNEDVSDKHNTDISPYSHSVDTSKFNSGYNNYFDNLKPDKQSNQYEYDKETVSDLGNEQDKDIRNSYNYKLQNSEAQLHIFIPDEQSLQSPEKQEKSDEIHYQNDPPDYHRDYPYQLPNERLNSGDAINSAVAPVGRGIPRLPDNLLEQLPENNGAGIRRNLVSPPSFDQQTDMTEHKAKCLPQPFVKLKYACNNTAQYKRTNQT